MPSPSPALAGRLARVPNIIFTSHGWAFNEDRPWWQKILIKLLHWLTVLLSHRTIAVSTGVLNEMRWPGAWRKMKVINPGRTIGVMYSKDEAREKICDFFPRLATHQPDPWLVCVAELHPIKRHEVLIRAFIEVLRTHPKARLICIGDGSEHSRLQAIIATHNLEASIFLIGTVPEAARFLKAFDLLALASKSESYGYVLHEAGLAEIPVVATNVGGMPDIVEDGETGTLVPPEDAPALAAAISRYLDNPTFATLHAGSLHKKLSARDLKSLVTKTSFLY
ncbi:glycosyltransferase [Patescibacteria group bacterium]|nr:glycosyltransferase [Patescibacteria group bacterium]